ncbi:unnamed protein product [Sphagnum troendelagicum]|uniref:Uncharacterized protein n=1 Tax=Sphagnum troendelagicum TaxID=128251 RepID=A0ABP0TNP7_9BRYO
MKRGGRLRVMKFLAHLLLMSLLGIKSGCNTEKVGGPNWDSSIASKAPQMLSNSKLTCWSHRQEQMHLSDLEMQVAQLCVENTTLLKGLTDISHKVNKAVVDNHVLRSDVEALLLLSNSMVS